MRMWKAAASVVTAAMVAVTLAGAASVAAQSASSRKGSLERITVHGRALEGNLEGDSPDRPVVVYLPPSYANEPRRRYPVLYFLHGYTATAEAYVKSLAVPDSIDRAIASGAREMIVVIPDAFTRYSGSMFSNSPTTGDWETFIARDLPEHIDMRYRTVATRDGRGLAGHSMGGYGTMRIGMKQPAAFAALYTMSSCCLMNDPAGRGAAAGRASRRPRGRRGTRRRPARGRRSRRAARPRRRHGQRPVGAGGRVGAQSAQPAAVLRPADAQRRDSAAHRREMDRQLTPGDGRSIRAGAEIDARDRDRRRRSRPRSRRRTRSSASR